MLLTDSKDPTETVPMSPEHSPDADQTPETPDTTLRDALDDYWATKPTGECIEALQRKASSYYNYCNATGKMALWRLVFEQYNRGYLTLGSVSRGGIEGELINLPVNEFRNIVDHVLGLTLQEKLALEAQPINNDYSTNAQMTLSEQLLEHYGKHKGMWESTRQTATNAYLFGEGSVVKLWNESIGELKMVDVNNQKIYRKGDVTFIEVNPTDLIRDIHVKKFKDNLWFTVRVFANKYELAAQYPDKAKEIIQRGTQTDWDNTRLTVGNDNESDLVPLFLFFYRQSAALPFGRMIFYLDKDLWLKDSHLEYRSMPVKTMMPSPTESLNFGYTPAFDLLPLQQVVDILWGAIATNNFNFAISNIIEPEGCNLGVADVIGSMNLLKYNASVGKPEALNLVSTPKETYAFKDQIVQRMEVLAGLSSTIRGQIDEKITSGAMAALYASQAIHFNSLFQSAYVQFVGELATGIIQDLQDHPEEKRTGLIAGKANRAYLKEFYGKDVNQIDRIVATIGSAFIQTDAGKLQMATDLITTGIIKDAQQYIEVLKTGSVEPILEGQHKQMMRIKQENEALAEGQRVKAMMTDDHVTDILEHSNVISDPAIRMSNDPSVAKIVENTLAHIMEHIELLGKMPPILAAVLKLPVLNQGGGPPPPGGAPHPAAPNPSGPPSAPPMAPKPPLPPGAPAAPKPPAAPVQKMPVKPGMTPGNVVSIPPPAQNPMAPHPGNVR